MTTTQDQTTPLFATLETTEAPASLRDLADALESVVDLLDLAKFQKDKAASAEMSRNLMLLVSTLAKTFPCGTIVCEEPPVAEKPWQIVTEAKKREEDLLQQIALQGAIRESLEIRLAVMANALRLYGHRPNWNICRPGVSFADCGWVPAQRALKEAGIDLKSVRPNGFP